MGSSFRLTVVWKSILQSSHELCDFVDLVAVRCRSEVFCLLWPCYGIPPAEAGVALLSAGPGPARENATARTCARNKITPLQQAWSLEICFFFQISFVEGRRNGICH